MRYGVGMICPVCGDGKLREEYREEEFKYKDVVRSIGFRAYGCSVCDEFFMNVEESRDLEARLRDIREKIEFSYRG